MNGVLHTIIGVAPEDFYGTFVGWAMKFWVPASMEDTFEAGGYKLEDRGERWIEAYGRLKPGVSLEQAQQEVSAVAKRLETDYPATNRGHGVKLWPLWQTPFNNAGTLLPTLDRKSTRLNSSHGYISYAVFCLKKKKKLLQTGRFHRPTGHDPGRHVVLSGSFLH